MLFILDSCHVVYYRLLSCSLNLDSCHVVYYRLCPVVCDTDGGGSSPCHPMEDEDSLALADKLKILGSSCTDDDLAASVLPRYSTIYIFCN